MESLPNNAEKAVSKQPEKRVDKVVKSEVKHRQTFGRMIRDSFVPADVENAGSYILENMLVPGIRDGVFNILRSILDYWSGGVGGPRMTTNNNGPRVSRVNQFDYGNRFKKNAGGPPESSSTPNQRYAYDDLVVGTLQEAEEVLASLKDIIRVYQVARVADLFDLVGVTGSYTDNNFGWTNLDRASYQRVSGGWLLIFPKAMPIDD